MDSATYEFAQQRLCAKQIDDSLLRPTLVAFSEASHLHKQIEFDQRYEQYGPHDYFDYGLDCKCTMAELATRYRCISLLNEYWWHDPRYASSGSVLTVAMLHHQMRGCYEPNKQRNIETLPEYWWHDAAYQVPTDPPGYSPTVAMVCAQREGYVCKYKDAATPRQIMSPLKHLPSHWLHDPQLRGSVEPDPLKCFQTYGGPQTVFDLYKYQIQRSFKLYSDVNDPKNFGPDGRLVVSRLPNMQEHWRLETVPEERLQRRRENMAKHLAILAQRRNQLLQQANAQHPNDTDDDDSTPEAPAE